MLGFDRFGANPELRQRPFDIDSVFQWMADGGLDKAGGSTDARLVVTHANDAFGSLAPSIEHLVVDEANEELTLVGQFGTTGDIEVTVEGRSLPSRGSVSRPRRRPTSCRRGSECGRSA
jgi:hypothetical protein